MRGSTLVALIPVSSIISEDGINLPQNILLAKNQLITPGEAQGTGEVRLLQIDKLNIINCTLGAPNSP